MTAEHTGFRTVISPEQKLFINQALRIDVKMEVGAEKQTINVGVEAAPVETVNPTLGQSITGRTLTNMPLNGRDILDLALLQPGVTESDDDNSGAGQFSVVFLRSLCRDPTLLLRCIRRPTCTATFHKNCPLIFAHKHACERTERTLLSALRKVKKRTTLRAEWTCGFFD